MYDDFAQVYDSLMQEIDYKEWADYIFRILLNCKHPVKSILEFGCGTGNITVELAKKGFDMTAVDISESMLTVCDEKVEKEGLDNVRLFKGDMRNFRIDEKFDAVICCCDSINYLEEMKDIENFIMCASDVLVPNGMLTFDMNTPVKYHDVIGDNTFVYNLDDVFCVWENLPDFDNNVMNYDLSFFIRRDDGLYERYEEEQKQHIFNVENVFKLLRNPELKDQKIYAFGTFLAGGSDCDRVQYVAEKR